MEDRTPFQQLDQTATSPYSRRHYAALLLWRIVEATLFRFSPRRACGWRRWLLRLFGAEVASTAKVWPTTRVRHPWLFKLGAWSAVAEDARIYNLGPVTIGEHTVVSQRAHLCAGTHDHRDPTLPLQRPPIVIADGVWVCVEAFIGPGVTIGADSVVGARAVVVRDVPPNSVAAGNPARVVGPRVAESSPPSPASASSPPAGAGLDG